MTLLMLQAAPLHDGSSSQWSCDVVVITTAQLNSTKAGLVLHRLNPACNMSDIHNDDGLWQCPQSKIRLNLFRWSTIPQKQFIIISSSFIVITILRAIVLKLETTDLKSSSKRYNSYNVCKEQVLKPLLAGDNVHIRDALKKKLVQKSKIYWATQVTLCLHC